MEWLKRYKSGTLIILKWTMHWCHSTTILDDGTCLIIITIIVVASYIVHMSVTQWRSWRCSTQYRVVDYRGIGTSICSTAKPYWSSTERMMSLVQHRKILHTLYQFATQESPSTLTLAFSVHKISWVNTCCYAKLLAEISLQHFIIPGWLLKNHLSFWAVWT